MGVLPGLELDCGRDFEAHLIKMCGYSAQTLQQRGRGFENFMIAALKKASARTTSFLTMPQVLPCTSAVVLVVVAALIYIVVLT